MKDLFIKLCKNAGLDENTELQSILAQDGLPESVPEHFANLILAGNMSEEAAQNNPKIKKHFQDIEKRYFFNLYDGELKKNLVELGLSEQEIKDVLTMEGQYGEKMKKAFELSKREHSKNKTTTDKDKEDERIKTINDLSAKLKQKDDEIEKDYVKKSAWDELQFAIKKDKLNTALRSKTATINLASHFEDDREAISEVIMSKISKKYLVELGENNQIKLKNLSDPSLDATDENNALLSFENALAKESLQYAQKTPDQQKKEVTFKVDNTLLSGRDTNDQKADQIAKKYADLL